MATKALTVKLLATVYDQLQPDKDGNITRDSETIERTQGEVFECVDQAEYDRLTAERPATASGRRRPPIAVDPDEELAQRKKELDARVAQLEAERAALDAEIKTARSGDGPRDASKLAGKTLAAALERFGLDDSGSADDKRARVQEYLDANTDASLAPAE